MAARCRKTAFYHNRLITIHPLNDRRPIRHFKRFVLPILRSVVPQIGIKEIRNAEWKYIIEAFPDARVIITGRDPRDIYISLFYKMTEDKKKIRLSGPFRPDVVARDLVYEFQYQKKIYERLKGGCMKVRYEDFCADPKVLDEIKGFVMSDIPGPGSIERMNRHHRDVHEGEITQRRVNRWMHEDDRKLVGEAQEVFDLMPEYSAFWGYDKDKGPISPPRL